MNLVESLLTSGLLIPSAPLVLAAMGGLVSERSGVMNIALEGKMLTAACVAALVSVAAGSAWIGALAGVGSAVALSLLHAVLTQAYRVDHIISGMAINAIAIGGTNFLSKTFKEASVAKIPQVPIETFVVLALVAPMAIAVVLRRTRPGLHLLAVGNDPEKARQMGVRPLRVRYGALVGTGLLCGLAGWAIVNNAGSFTDGMTAGRGFIALAALIVGGWRPLPAAAACLVFGLLNILQIHLQGTHIAGADLPREFWNALPYLVTVVAMAGLLGRTRSPSGLGKP